ADRVVRPDQRGGRLEEEQGLLGHLVAQLGGVIGVVATDAHHLARQDRREQPDVGERPALAGQLDVTERVTVDLRDDLTVAVAGAFHDAEREPAAVGEPSDTHPSNLAEPALRWAVWP